MKAVLGQIGMEGEGEERQMRGGVGGVTLWVKQAFKD